MLHENTIDSKIKVFEREMTEKIGLFLLIILE